MSTIPMIDDKCTGAMVASAIGDALGWANEARSNNSVNSSNNNGYFAEWTRRSGGRYWSHYEKILPGEYSDDTQLILAVSRSLICGEKWKSHLITELVYWLEYERGGGIALKNAANILKSNKMPWDADDAVKYFNAGGNGATMRVLPHVIAQSKENNFAVIAANVISNSIYTHGHPRAIIGAVCYAYALWYLLNKKTSLEYGEIVKATIENRDTWDTFPTFLTVEWLNAANQSLSRDYRLIWQECVETIISELQIAQTALESGLLDSEQETLHQLGCYDKRVNGAGDVAAVAAMYMTSKYANNPTLGIKSAAYAIGIDTDTIASMTGGLLGMLRGMSWIPAEWKLVQDYDCLMTMSRLLLANDKVKASKDYVASINMKDYQWHESKMGKIRLLSESKIQSGRTTEVSISKMINQLGQTFYIKKFVRTEQYQNNIQNSKTYASLLNISLNINQVSSLLNNKEIQSIRFKKVLQVLQMLLEGQSNSDLIAKKLKCSVSQVEAIKALIG